MSYFYFKLYDSIRLEREKNKTKNIHFLLLFFFLHKTKETSLNFKKNKFILFVIVKNIDKITRTKIRKIKIEQFIKDANKPEKFLARQIKAGNKANRS